MADHSEIIANVESEEVDLSESIGGVEEEERLYFEAMKKEDEEDEPGSLEDFVVDDMDVEEEVSFVPEVESESETIPSEEEVETAEDGESE